MCFGWHVSNNTTWGYRNECITTGAVVSIAQSR
jgi:hypothetical protein